MSELAGKYTSLKQHLRRNAIFVSPKVKGFLADTDALSQDLTVFRYSGSTVNGEEAIPYILLDDRLKEVLRKVEREEDGQTKKVDS